MDRLTAFYAVLAVLALGLTSYAIFRRRAAAKGNRAVRDSSRTLRAVLSFLVLGASAWVTLTASPNLGLDLEGGAQITLEAESTPTVEANAENTDRALEVLRRRVDALGVAEPSISRSGENRIIVELPGVEDPREAAEAVGRTAQLTFHPVLGFGQPEDPATDESADDPATDEDANVDDEASANVEDDGENGDEPATEDEAFDPSADEIAIDDERGSPIVIGPSSMTGEEVSNASAQYDVQQAGGWFVDINFTGAGGSTWGQLTGDAACFPDGDPQRRIAIVLDEEVITSPQVTGASCNVGHRGGTSMITGNFTQESSEELSALIEGGALPLPVNIIEQRVVGPTLGSAAITASAWAAIIGMALTAGFIVFVYRLVGLMAIGALLGYALIAFSMISALGATLTLPGLAGFVLAIGMAIDANVLIFERAREDYVDGNKKSLRFAVPSGFKNAFSAIIDTNITSFLAAGLLFFLAAGPVRGFGVTLSIGVIASFFSALVLSRVFTEWLVDRPWVREHPLASGIGRHGRVRLWLRERTTDVMRHSRRFLAASLIAIILAGAGFAVRGFNLGIEFTGGRLVEVSANEPVDVNDARDVVSDLGFPTAVVNESGSSGEDAISIRASDMSDDQAQEVIEAVGELGGGGQLIRDELIGPSLGNELQRNALIAFGIALMAQLIYLAIRFRWTLGTGAVVALFQNVIVTLGIFAWLGKPIDGIFLAAMLAIIGYTVNDSVVLFDRIREGWTRRRDQSFSELSSRAIFNTLPRSVNTGLSTIFLLAALYILGGDSLSDFALALIIGILIGTYSSNFTAAPLAVELEKRYPAPEPEEKQTTSSGQRDDPNYGAVV